MRYVFKVLACFFSTFLFVTESNAQVTIQGFVYNEKNQALSNATITIKPDGNAGVVAFGFADVNGRFQVKYPTTDFNILTATVSLIGYISTTFTLKPTDTGLTKVVLRQSNTALPEVFVKNKAIYTRGDTVNYNVKSFTQKQDMVIADIIRKLPGIEITESGVIKYQGRPINKYYIDGLDLLDDKYGLANNNLPANAVDQVQILENHQPIKSLDSFAVSNRAALNLKLNASARNKIIGKAKIGFGAAPLLIDNELVPMKFSKRGQTIASYKYTNAGYSYLDELALLNGNDFMNGIKGFVDKNSFLNVVLPALPNVKKYRFLFNNLHTLSINQLTKVKGTYELKFNLDYIKDLQKQETGSQNRIFFNQDTVLINERQQIRKKQEVLRAFITLTSNTSKRYIKNVTSTNIISDRDLGLIHAKDTAQQSTRVKVQSFFNDFTWFRVKNKMLTGISSFISYSSQPQQLQVFPGKYEGILNNNIKYAGIQQDLRITTFFTNNGVTLNRRFRRFMFENKTGSIFLSQHLTSGLAAIQANQLEPVADSFVNNLTGQQFSIYNNAGISFTTKKILVAINIPIAYYHINNVYTNTHDEKQLETILFNGTVNARYSFSSDWGVDAEARYSHDYLSPTTSTNRFILSNYRTLKNQNAIIQPFNSETIKLQANYKNAVKYLFANLGVTVEKNEYSTLFDQQYIGQLLISNSVQQPNPATNYSIFGKISKYLYKIGTSVSASCFATKRLSNQLTRTQSSTFVNNILGVSTKVNARIKQWSVDYDGTYQQTKSGFEGAKTTGAIRQLNQSLAITASIPWDCLLKLTTDQSGFKQGMTINRNYYFADISLRKQTVKPKMDVELLWQNIFNTNSFETLSIFSNNETNNFYTIRPSQVMCRITFLF
ncbi:MAG: carboxypeptidase-like regulatory domain-containing protein [Chitinophagaceae bacterium]